MNNSLRIAVADDEAEMREYLESTLALLGHQVVAVVKTGCELVERCRAMRPNLVITDIRMPDMDGLDAIHEIGGGMSIPVIIVSAHHDPEAVARALDNQVLAYLVKPIKQADLETAIAVAIRRFREFQALGRQTDSLRQALEDRKLIERAKGILMQRTGIDEPAAFTRLQKLASDNNWKLAEAARSLLASDAALRSPQTSQSPPGPGS
jgi:response regulator NasT